MSDLSYVYSGAGTCRACDAPIQWWRTPAGKNMPVDDDGSCPREGELVSREDAKTRLLPRAHWSTCPEAGRFRR